MTVSAPEAEASVWPWRLPLSRGLFAEVDEIDFERSSAHKWTAFASDHTFYAYWVNSPSGPVSLHRFLLGAAAGTLIDHRDRNGLNNRRKNLRFCTYSQNMHNRGKHVESTSHFKGVWYDRRWRWWRAEIKKDNKKIELGRFPSEIEAALQYDRAARLMFGRFACTNESMGRFQGYEERELGLARPKGTRALSEKALWRAEMERLGINPEIA